MTIYDLAVIGVVAIGVAWGAWKGAIWQVAGLLSLWLGYTVAHPGSGALAARLSGDPVTRRMGAMLLIYVLTSGGVFTAAWTLRSFLRKIRLEEYDKHLGMLLGGAMGASLALIGTLFITSLAPESRPVIFKSLCGRLAARGLEAIETYMPDEARDELEPFLGENERQAIADAAEGRVPDEAETDIDSGKERLASRAIKDRRVTRAQATSDDDVSEGDFGRSGSTAPRAARGRSDSDPESTRTAPAGRPSTRRRTASRNQVFDSDAAADDNVQERTSSRSRLGQKAGKLFEGLSRTLTSGNSDQDDDDADARRR